MESYSISKFNEIELHLCRLAEAVVGLLPDNMTGGRLARCHEVARVVARVAELYAGRRVLYVQDGRYGFCDHSWLWTSEPDSSPSRLRCPNILDPYCVGSLPQVRLLECQSTALPHFGLMYQLGTERDDVDLAWVGEQSATISSIVRTQVVSWERAVEIESLRLGARP